MDTTTKSNLEAVCKSAETILELEAQLTGNPIDGSLRDKLRLWRAGVFRIVVMGEIKSGKSSFINALLGFPGLVPVHSDVATSTIFKISYGEKIGYKVFFLKDSGKKPLEIDAAQVDAYGTENGNPGNEKQVDCILVTCPSPLLKGGLVIVDTPGLGGLFRKHKLITYHYVPRADAVFIVTDGSSAPIGKAELDLLADLQKVIKHVSFIQNKSRVIDKEAREQRTQNNLEIIANHGKTGTASARLFVVDSMTKANADKVHDDKKLERSGFPNVIAFVDQDIQANAHRIIIERIAAEMYSHIHTVESALVAHSKLIGADSEEKRKILIEEYKSAQAEFVQFENYGKAQVQKILDDGVDIMDEIARNAVKCFRPQSEYAKELKRRIDGEDSIDGVIQEKESVRQSLSEKLSEDSYKCIVDIKEQAERVLQEAASVAKGQSFKGKLTRHDDVNVTVDLDSSLAERKPSFYEKGKGAFYGSLAGGGVYGVVGGFIGGVIGTFSAPGPGTVVGAEVGAELGAAFGTLFGAKKGYDDVNRQSLSAAKLSAKQDIGFWISICNAVINDSITPIAKTWKKQIERALAESIKRYSQALNNQFIAIKERERLSSNELADRSRTLQKQQADVRHCKEIILGASR